MNNSVQVEVPELGQALTPYDRLQLQRARKIIYDAADWQTRFDGLTPDDFVQIVAGLSDALRHMEAWLEPVDKATIIETLADFADMLQVSAPSAAGVDLYVAAMEQIPRNLMGRARKYVARNHRFARLPLPADFEAAIAGELLYCKGQIASVDYLLQSFMREQRRRSAERSH